MTWTHEYHIYAQKLRGFTITAEGDRLYTIYTFHSEEEKTKFEQISLTGLTFLSKGELVEPNPPAHAYAFDMGSYLKSKGARGIFEVSSWNLVNRNSSIVTWLAKQRFMLKQHIESTFPKALVAEAEALLIGIQENVDEELQRAYQKLGITHLFAISGLHVALVTWLLYEGMLRLHIRKEWAMLALVMLLPAYGVIAGGAPSVWRSVLVVELVLFVRFLRWKLPIDDALALSFICFVLWEPGVIYQVGFQLSYVATASLIYSGCILANSSNWWVKSFLITFVCQLLVYPLLLWHFYEISISSLFANILFVPLFSFVILPINLVLLAVSYVSSDVAKVLFTVYEPLRSWVTDLIIFLQDMPLQVWSPGRPNMWLIMLAYGSVLFAFVLLERRGRVKWLLGVLFVPALCIHVTPILNGDLRVTFLNVGQGDCAVIELPHRRGVYVVDTGGLLRFQQDEWKESNRPYEVGRQVVVPFLKGRGIRTVDTLTLTHADADHVEGAEEVLEEIKVREVHVTPGSLEKAIMDDFLTVARNQRVPIKERMVGASWRDSETQFAYLWPKDTKYEGNDDSLVLLVKQEDFTLLMTGDLEETGEQQLLKDYGQLVNNVTVLKAGHHGSKTSSSEPFVEHTNPRLTIFSAGLNNRYGHPHPTVKERFASRRLPYLITAEVGTITIRVKNHAMKVENDKTD